MGALQSNMKVDEDYFTGLESSFEELCNEMCRTLKNYNKIMEKVTTTAIPDGETSEALSEFAGIATELNGLLRDSGSCMKAQLKAFLLDIDSADKYIY